MNAPRYHDARAEHQTTGWWAVLKWSVIALGVIVLFGLVFALIPTVSNEGARTGVKLRDVQLRLYPAQDQNAEWRFKAPELSFDPLKSEATITGLESGERWARAAVDPANPDAARPLERDLTIQTPELTIDANDNIRTAQANIVLVKDCYSISLQSSDKQPVLIDQNQGISAPLADVRSPAINSGYEDFRTGFDLSGFNGIQKEGATVQSAPDVECVNGQVIPKPRR